MSDSEVEHVYPVIPPDRTVSTLDQLVAGITEENRLNEIEWGPPVGAEAW